jgi:hydrogenase nickel incorporation protein HypB
MCTTCGCGSDDVRIDGHAHHHHHGEAGGAHSHAAGIDPERAVAVERDILAKNDSEANANRRGFTARGVFALNLVSSPGSGKTTLLVETIKRLSGDLPIAVIEGDQQTSRDADRIRATGAKAVQVNTGKGCHLDAHMVGHAVGHLAPREDSVLMIENVGNLVCPSAFDLGEAHKVVVLSVTEGEDKPLKYPDMFAAADLMLLNKCDLLPHLDFDADLCEANARRINPAIQVMRISALKGDGLDPWINWIRGGAKEARGRRIRGTVGVGCGAVCTCAESAKP